MIDPAEIERLIQQIDESPDKLHGDYTPSVYRLIEMGEPVLSQVLSLMLSHGEMTRLRAQRVLEGVTMKRFGFQVGKGWVNPQDEERWQRFWNDLGDLSYDAPLETRVQASNRWREWLAQSKI